MQDLETLTIDDITRIFRRSRITVYRNAEAVKEGRPSCLPPPLPSGPKQSLRWNAEKEAGGLVERLRFFGMAESAKFLSAKMTK